MDKNNLPAQPHRTPSDVAAQFIAKNIYKHRSMAVQDKDVTPWDLRDSLINEHSHNLYEVKSTFEGDVVSVNDGQAIIYVGNSAFSRAAKRSLVVDDYIQDALRGVDRPGGGGGSIFLLVMLVILSIAVAMAVM